MKSPAILLLVAAAAAGAGDHPLTKDRTGLAWVLPFETALKTAKERGHLLLIKPVAFGTTPDGGW